VQEEKTTWESEIRTATYETERTASGNE